MSQAFCFYRGWLNPSKGLFLEEIDCLLRIFGGVDDVPGLSFNIGGYGVLSLSSACCGLRECKVVVCQSDPSDKGLGLHGTDDFWLLKVKYKLTSQLAEEINAEIFALK